MNVFILITVGLIALLLMSRQGKCLHCRKYFCACGCDKPCKLCTCLKGN
jgi:hypothetical protein